MTKRRRTRRMTVHPLRTFSFGHLLIAFAIASGAAADGEKTPSPRGDTAPDKPALIQLS